MTSDVFLELKTYVLYTEGGKEQHLADLLTNTILEIHPEAAKRAYVPLRAYLKDVKKDGEKVWVKENRVLFTGYVFVESSQIEKFNKYLYEPGFATPYMLFGKGSSRVAVGSGAKRVVETGGIRSNRCQYVKVGIKPDRSQFEETDTSIISVSDADMKRLRMLMGEDDFVDVSRGIKENGRVRFTSGPLAGLDTGKIIKINRHKRYATVQTEFLGELRNIDVAIEVLSSMAGDAS